MAGRVRVRAISNDEGNRLLRIVRRSSGSVVTWRRAQTGLPQFVGISGLSCTRFPFHEKASRCQDLCGSRRFRSLCRRSPWPRFHSHSRMSSQGSVVDEQVSPQPEAR